MSVYTPGDRTEYDVPGSDWFTQNAPAPAAASSSGPAPGTPEYLKMVEDRLRAEGGGLFDPSDMEGFVRNAQQGQGSGTGPNGESWAGAGAALENQLAIYGQRRASDGGPQGASGGGSSSSSGGGSPISSFASPRPYKPFEEVFSWDPSKVKDDPAYQFRQSEEANAITRSAMSKGAFLTGTTADELQKRAAGVAAQYEDADYARTKGDYLTRANIWDTNENAMYSTGRSNVLDQFGMMDTTRKFDFNVMDSDRNFARATSNDEFDHLFRFADYGQTANGQLAASAAPAARLGSDTITNQGNADAVAGVTGANAWADAAGTAMSGLGRYALSRSNGWGARSGA